MSRTESRLQQELQQSRPFRSIYQEAALAVLKTADLLRRGMSMRLESYDITPQQYNVLRILRGAGPEGLPTLSIGERLIEEMPGMTRLLDRLESKGLVLRKRCNQDRRQMLCFISEAGEQLLTALDPVIANSEEQLSAALTPEQAETLAGLLEKVRCGIRLTNQISQEQCK